MTSLHTLDEAKVMRTRDAATANALHRLDPTA